MAETIAAKTPRRATALPPMPPPMIDPEAGARAEVDALLGELAAIPRWDDGLDDLRPEAYQRGAHPMVDTSSPLDLDGARARIRDIITTALVEGKQVAMAAPPGTGKTQATIDAVIGWLAGDEDRSIRIAMPTNALAHEVAERYRGALRGAGQFISVEVASTRNDRNCLRHGVIAAAHRVAPWMATEVCKRCDHHPDNSGPTCPFWERAGRSRGARIQITTHALECFNSEREDGDEAPPSRLIVDESPDRACLAQDRVTVADLATLAGHGDLRDTVPTMTTAEGVEISPLLRLMQIMSESVGGKQLDGETIEALLPADLLEVAGSSWQDEAWERARHIRDDAARIDYLDSMPSACAVNGIGQALTREWRGAFIKDGVLYVTSGRRFPLEPDQAIIALDATATARSIRSTYGDTVELATVHVPFGDDVRVTQIMQDTGTGSHIGCSSSPSGKRRLGWTSAAMRWLREEGSLLITYKKAIQDPESWTNQTLRRIGARCDVIHHLGVEARGSNLYEDHHTVVVDSLHTPRLSIRATAEVMAARCGEALDDEWLRQGEWQAIGAQLVQEIGRLRPLSATPGERKHIIIFDERDLHMLIGVRPDSMMTMEQLAWEEMREPDPSVIPEIIEAMVERGRGTYAPTLEGASPDPMTWDDLRTDRHKIARSLAYEVVSTSADTTTAEVEITSHLTPAPVSSWLCRHHQRGDDRAWETSARRAGMSLRWVKTDRGGDAAPILHRVDSVLEDSAVARWVETTTAKRWCLDGREDWVLVREEQDNLDRALRGLPDNHEELTVAMINDDIGKRCGVSGATISRLIRRLARPGERQRDTLIRLIVEAKLREGARIMREAEDAALAEAARRGVDPAPLLEAARAEAGPRRPKVSIYDIYRQYDAPDEPGDHERAPGASYPLPYITRAADPHPRE